ncbi:DUF368 domain-containing protein, partial [Burkholderia multivorans]|uniref:DUF368 domain-containing protein n=2 Tax=Bacteria TaxID=2 RepID=UPI000DB31ACE
LIMAGLMLGSLRALWPWQSAAEVGSDGEPHGAGGLLAPYDPVLGPILLAAVGAVVVLILIVIESRFAGKRNEESSQGV